MGAKARLSTMQLMNMSGVSNEVECILNLVAGLRPVADGPLDIKLQFCLSLTFSRNVIFGALC
jgi:hypothetical protein